MRFAAVRMTGVCDLRSVRGRKRNEPPIQRNREQSVGRSSFAMGSLAIVFAQWALLP